MTFWAKVMHPFYCTFEPVLWDKFGTGRRDQPSDYVEKCVVCGLYRNRDRT